MFSPFGFNPYFSGYWRDPFEDVFEDVGETEQQQQPPQPRLSRRQQRKLARQLQQQQQQQDTCTECAGTGRQQQSRLPIARSGQLQSQQGKAQGQGTLTQTGVTALSLPEDFQRPLDVDLNDENDRLVLRAQLYGVPQDKIDLSIDDGVLNLTAQRQHTARDQQSSLNFSETLRRSIPLPQGVDESKIQANFRDGQLEVVVPKPALESANARRIPISGTAASKEKMTQAPISESDQQGVPTA
jgi:HSP20 family protein